jgi:glucose/arabinose dehydrogenase
MSRKNIWGKIFLRLIIPVLSVILCCNYSSNTTAKSDFSGITLPPGFKIDIYAENVIGARSMALSPNGILYVGTRDAGKIYAILDTNHDYKADEIITIDSGLNMPNGVAFKNDDLYVAEINRIIRFDNIEANLNHPPKPVVVFNNYPADHPHGWKFIRIGPDGKLYVPVGAPCNICMPDDRHACITRINLDGSGYEVYATGVRNSVGFDWDPVTNDLWFTDNGRDMLGDNLPPDELNHAPKKGMNFGFPYVYGDNVPNPEFAEQDKSMDLSKFTKPAQDLGPHVASLGMRFYTGNMFPPEYKNQIFIAEHGSWNRSKKIGYRVSLVKLDSARNPISYQPFAYGWLKAEQTTGRPVDIQIMPDGSMLVSDDYANMIYRISYSK